MLFKIEYTDGSYVIKEFDTYLECYEWCMLEGDHVLGYEPIEEAHITLRT